MSGNKRVHMCGRLRGPAGSIPLSAVSAARYGSRSRHKLAIVPGLPPIPVALSTSSVYPERTPDAFEMAARLGYDGVEIMVYTDP